MTTPRWTRFAPMLGLSLLCASCLTTKRLQPDKDLQSVAEVMSHIHLHHRDSNLRIGAVAVMAAFTANLAQKRIDQLATDKSGSPLPYSLCEYWPLVGVRDSWPKDTPEILPASIDEVADDDLIHAKTVKPRGGPARDIPVEDPPAPAPSDDSLVPPEGDDATGEASDKPAKADAKKDPKTKAEAEPAPEAQGPEGSPDAPADGEAEPEGAEPDKAKAKPSAAPKPPDPLIERIAAIFDATPDSVEDTLCEYGDEGPRSDPPAFGMATPSAFESHDVWFRVDEAPIDRLEAFVGKGVTLPGASAEDGEELLIHGVLAPARYLDAPADLVIIIPGMFDSVEQSYVRDTMAFVHDLGYSALALDMRGHGDTYRLDLAQNKRLDHGYSFGLFESNDVLTIMERLWSEPLLSQVGNIYVMGFSGGGRVALLASELEASRPLVPDQTANVRRDWRVLATNPMLETQATINNTRSPHFPLNLIFYRNPIGSIFAELVALRQEFASDNDAPTCITKQMGTGIRASNTASCGTQVLEAIRDTHIETYAKSVTAFERMTQFNNTAPFAAAKRPPATQPLPARLITSAKRTTSLFSASDDVVKVGQQKRFERGIYELVGQAKTCKRLGSKARIRRNLEAPDCRQSIVTRSGGHMAYLAVNRPLARQALALWLADRITPEQWDEDLDNEPALDYFPRDGSTCWIGPLRRPVVGTQSEAPEPGAASE